VNADGVPSAVALNVDLVPFRSQSDWHISRCVRRCRRGAL